MLQVCLHGEHLIIVNKILSSPDFLHLVMVGGGLAGLNDLMGYTSGKFMFLVGPPKPDRV